MPGAVIRALAKTSYNFSMAAATTGPVIVVAKGIDVSQYREVVAVVRIHAASVNASGASVAVGFLYDAPTNEDPALDWATADGSVPGGAKTITFNLTSGVTSPGAGSFYFCNITNGPTPTPAGGWLKLTLQPAMGATASTLTVTISIDIIAKS